MKINIKFEIDLISLGIGVILGVVPFWFFATSPDITELRSSSVGVILAALLAGVVELLKARAKKIDEE